MKKPAAKPKRSTRKVAALVLAGGLGTRLRPLTFTIPKPLLPIGKQSILEVLVEKIRSAGITDIVLSVGYHAELIKAYCHERWRFGMKLRYVTEEKPLGTAGPLRLLDDLLKTHDTVLLINGDVVTDLDFWRLVEFHEEQSNELTIAYKHIEDTSPFGVLKIRDKQILDIEEKPKRTHDVSTGIYVLNRTAISHIPKNKFFTVPDLALKLIRKGHRVGAFYMEDFWLAVESFSHFDEALEALSRSTGAGGNT